MNKQAMKDVLYGGLIELMGNRDYYYHSVASPKYSYWTELGKEALTGYFLALGDKILEAEEESLNKRAKELVLKGLKGETV
jgi:hypothetical protein